MAATAEPSPARLGKPTAWFIVNWLALWPLAIASLALHWIKIDRSAALGDATGAAYHVRRVRLYGKIALAVLPLTLLVLVLLAATISFSTKSCSPDSAGNLMNC
jgi:hypothetical protein